MPEDSSCYHIYTQANFSIDDTMSCLFVEEEDFLQMVKEICFTYVCPGTRVCFASEQCFPAPETGSATLATCGKHGKYKLRASNSSVFLY